MKKLLNNKFFRVVFVYFIPIIIGGVSDFMSCHQIAHIS